MSIRTAGPYIASLGNVAAGVIACACAVAGAQELGALMILAAVLLDSLDGALARTLQVEGEFGAQLDSLADVISFGVAPAVLVGSLLPVEVRHLGWALVTVYPLCAAWRLARFNTERVDGAEHSAVFAGLPTTGAGAASGTAIMMFAGLDARFPSTPLLLPVLLVLLGILMVSRVPYRHVGAILSRLSPALAAAAGLAFVVGVALWRYEHLFGVLTWGYVASGPLSAATQKIIEVRHAWIARHM